MKTKRILSILLTLATCLGLLAIVPLTAHAEGVDITAAFTDPNFRAAVYEEIGKTAPEPIYDTDVAEVTWLFLYNKDIQSLAGLEYFIDLRYLRCDNNQLTSLPTLPDSLENLNCRINSLTVLPALPAGLEILNCTDNQLTSLPALPAGLENLDCHYNQLTALPALPAGLEILNCSDNQLTVLPALPAGLEILNCSDNQLTALPALPEGLERLNCTYNQLTSLPALPAGLEKLDCLDNQLTALPALPAGLKWLHCHYNQLTVLPALPAGLESLACYFNQLTALPALPVGLTGLECDHNQLTGLDVTGLELEYLYCSYNNMANEAAVIGFTGTWDDEYFWFWPQNSYTVTINGTASNTAMVGETVNITATVPEGKRFVNWTTASPGVTFANANSPSTSFVMPANAVTVTATYKDVDDDDTTEYFTLWGKFTTWEKTPLNWIFLILCFGWIWMAF